MKKLVYLLLCLFMATGLAMAQTTQITGTVVSAEDGEPIIGASITVKGTTIGTSSDFEGKFTLGVPVNTTTVHVTYLGMKPVDVPVSAVMNIRMETSHARLDEVMVVAYGTAKKESFTGSAAVIGDEKIQKRTVTNVTKAIEGTVAGVQTTTGSGQPGSGISIRIRGVGSLNSSSDPLYVVDGAPFSGSISSINPADIETMTILKDAAAGALYGARGANGVVLITTKRGSDTGGKAKVEFKALWSISSRATPRYDLMDEKDFLETNFFAYRNVEMYKNGVPAELAGAAAINAMVNGNNKMFGVDEQYNPYNMPIAELIDPITGKVNPAAQLRYNDDWLDEVMADNPLRQEYNVNLTGGFGNTRYFTSLNYLNEEGLLKTTSYERISGRANLDTAPVDWLKFGLSSNFAYTKTGFQGGAGTTGYSNPWFSAEGMGPIYPIYKIDDKGERVYDFGENRPQGASSNSNIAALVDGDKYRSYSDNFQVHGYFKLDFSDPKYDWAQGLSLTFGVNADTRNLRQTEYYNPYFGNAAATDGRLSKYHTRDHSYTINQLLGYNRTFDETHNIEVLLGHEYELYKYNYLLAQKTGFPFGGIYETSPGATLAAATSYQHNLRRDSYLGRLKYSYADKYNFEASLRRDASSRFHKDHRWGTFWSVGGNWRVSEEEFMQQFDWLNNLSLRASYGVQGNDGLNTYYAWQALYSMSANSGYNAAYVTSLENKGILWEKNANFNVGLEARLFDGRLDVIAEFYRRTTSDMLLDIPVASSLGFDSYRGNIGTMYNQGFELTVGVDVIKTSNFDWRLNLIGYTMKNKITELASETPIIDGSRIWKKGESFFVYYLPKSAGVDPATGNQLYWVWDKRDPITNERASEMYISNDVAKARNSREVVKGKMPDFQGSIGSDFRLGNVDFSFLTLFSVGGKYIDNAYSSFTNMTAVGSAMHKDLLRAWKEPGDITDIPMFQYNNTTLTTTQADLTNASFFSFRNVTVGYTMPSRISKKFGIDTFRVFATADNLYTFGYMKGSDPMQSLTGSTAYEYTPARTVSLGLNLSF